MTDLSPLGRVRAAALLLPETEESGSDSQPVFLVAGEPFVQIRADGYADGVTAICVRTGGEPDWVDITLTGDPDWALVEDRIARSWELSAPARLLEAGGR